MHLEGKPVPLCEAIRFVQRAPVHLVPHRFDAPPLPPVLWRDLVPVFVEVGGLAGAVRAAQEFRLSIGQWSALRRGWRPQAHECIQCNGGDQSHPDTSSGLNSWGRTCCFAACGVPMVALPSSHFEGPCARGMSTTTRAEIAWLGRLRVVLPAMRSAPAEGPSGSCRPAISWASDVAQAPARVVIRPRPGKWSSSNSFRGSEWRP